MVDKITRRQILRGAAGLGALTVGGTGRVAADQPDRHIVGTSSQAAVEAAKRLADSVYRVLDFGDIGQAVAGVFSQEARDKLRKRDDVRYIEEDGEMHAIGHGDGNQAIPWGIDRVDADVVHHNGYTGDGAHIAIIDTGIDDDHEDLKANIGAGKAFAECGSRSCTGQPCFDTSNCNHAWSDDNDHGTHCAGIADAVNNSTGVVGVSTAATLHAVKVLDCHGCGSVSDVAAGINYTADQGWDVGSMSLGGSKSSTIEDAVEYAYGKGVLLVAAAGNDGSCTDCVNYPAAEPEVIAVSATNKSDDLAGFSSQGPEVELAAPGKDITSTVIDGYDTFSGTSMACPHVSGAGGQLMALGFVHAGDTTVGDPYPSDPGGARGRLQDTAEEIGLSDNEQGEGLLDAESAVPLPIGEVGRVSDVTQPDQDTWHTVSLQETYENPVIIMKPLSYNGVDPAHVRLRNVTSDGFEFQIEEWLYLDGSHPNAETINYLVLEAGSYIFPDGTLVETGTTTSNHTFTNVGFSQNFSSAPIVFSQSQSRNGGHPIVTRQKDISTGGFAVRLQEEEGSSDNGYHKDEMVGYIAIEPNAGTNDGAKYEMGRTAEIVTDDWHEIGFDQSYVSPLFLADMQTFNGGDSAGLRYQNLSGSSVEVFVEEEQSDDGETNHVNAETVGYFVIDESGLIYG